MFQRFVAQLGLTSHLPVTPAENCNGTCANCVKGGVKHIMTAVVEHVKKECKETKCPVLKKHCKMWAKHPKVSFGWLLEAVRPFGLSYSYCYGADKCSHPKTMEDRDPPHGMEEEFDNEDVGKMFDDVLAEAGHVHNSVFEAINSEGESDNLEFVQKGKCGGCIRKVAAKVMCAT